MALPPFAKVIKSREVEDPVNLWVHRPIAYAMVAAVVRTPITPNQMTLFALALGIAAGACWLVGTPALMVVGGALLWTSSIVDGADGILARAKGLQSELGRAFDGMIDGFVAFATVIPAFYHIWVNHHAAGHLVLMPIALLTAVVQVYIYDFYKESYLSSVNPNWDGRTRAFSDLKERLADPQLASIPFWQRFTWQSYDRILSLETLAIRLTNPRAAREHLRFVVNDETIRIYRKHNYWPMQLWTWVSLCPHTYLMATAGMFDRLYLYLWYRAVVANVLFVVAIIWQRVATARTLRELERIGAAPVNIESESA